MLPPFFCYSLSACTVIYRPSTILYYRAHYRFSEFLFRFFYFFLFRLAAIAAGAYDEQYAIGAASLSVRPD